MSGFRRWCRRRVNKSKAHTRSATQAMAPTMIATTGIERGITPAELLPEGVTTGVVPVVHELPELVLPLEGLPLSRLLSRLLPLVVVGEVTVLVDASAVDVSLGSSATEDD